MKKILVILIVLSILITPVASFAEQIDLVSMIPNDGNNYYVIVEWSATRYSLITASQPIKVKLENDAIVHTNGKMYDSTSSGWKHTYTFNGEVVTTGWLNSGRIVNSNYDVKTIDGLVFFSPPKVSQLLLTMKSPATITGWTTTLAGLTPLVGLTVLVISFQMGWAFLRRQLIT